MVDGIQSCPGISRVGDGFGCEGSGDVDRADEFVFH